MAAPDPPAIPRLTVIQGLLDLLDEAFDHPAWHGPNLRGSVRQVRPAQIVWRPGRGRHNVWELVVHATYWKYAVRRRLSGEKRGSFGIAGSNWFPRPDAWDERTAPALWREDVRRLVDEHVRLRALVAAFDPAALSRRAPGGPGRYTNAATIRGAASHDLYHAGQIQLLKKICPTR